MALADEIDRRRTRKQDAVREIVRMAAAVLCRHRWLGVHSRLELLRLLEGPG
ncbi:MAG: hypothetical protein KGL43_17345 [Burkholderiales bacterium]|nr:hypothetical protein [Burkholderiales bacterium]MDE2455355.1 hypothetical protein [Burkholderiales bacterium]